MKKLCARLHPEVTPMRGSFSSVPVPVAVAIVAGAITAICGRYREGGLAGIILTVVDKPSSNPRCFKRKVPEQ
jgi:hypothetical protein